MPSPAFTETDADRASLRRLLADAVQITEPEYVTDSGFAELVLGVKPCTLANYLSGARGLAWYAVRAAYRTIARNHPRHVPTLVRRLAREWVGVEGEWVPAGAVPAGSFWKECGEAQVALGRFIEAVQTKSPDADALGEALVKEIREAVASGCASAK